MISNRFEDIAQALRIFGEAKWRFNSLFLVDKAEAIGNVEQAISALLNSIHGLHDACNGNPEVAFNFYQSPLCCFVLAYRNAKHHNKAYGIRSVHVRARTDEPTDYLLVDFPAGESEEGGSFTEHFISWHDFCQFLDLPRQESRLRPEAKQLVRDRIGAETFESFASDEGYAERDVFINVIPIIIGAGAEFTPHIVDFVEPQSVEAKHFLYHFREVEQANFHDPQFMELTSRAFG